jgi:putative glutamine amidotransferase
MLKICKSFIYIALILILSYLSGCQAKEREVPLRIALSKGIPDTSYANYYSWIKTYDSTAVCIDMYGMPLDSALILFKDCSGLILTGGTDIEPALYGKAGDIARCWPVDHKRDSLEIALFNAARQYGTPILGICRGEQVINVACGGSLYVDIPTDFDTTVRHQCADYLSCFHSVTVESGSLLHEITGVYAGEVTSNHHQGVDRPGNGLKASSHAPDGFVEAVEWIYPEGQPFMIAVQWHPERMPEENPLSRNIARRFLEENKRFKASTNE